MTEIFLDTANLKEIEEIQGWNIISGITTNQKIFEKEKGVNFKEHANTILDMVYPLPVSLEGPNTLAGIIKVAKEFNYFENKNFVVKVPMLGNGDGLRAVKKLSDMNIKTNVTACMSLNQTFLAVLAGATYVSLFYNRMMDWKTEDTKLDFISKEHALNIVRATQEFINNNKSDTQLIVGSIRSPQDITELVQLNPNVITIPYKILKQMPQHDMTDKTLGEFEDAWREFKRYEKQ